MTKKEQTFKMGKNWAKRFVDHKKQNAGWKVNTINEQTQTIHKPDGSVFALFDTLTGEVHTSAHITEVQW